MNKMKVTLRKYFIPHEGNSHKPHILRIQTTLIVFSIILLVETVFLAQIFLVFRQTDFLASVISKVLVDQTNTERELIEVSSLGTNSLLEEAARLKAEDMAEKGYFAHVTPEGFDPWYWLGKANYDFVTAGENLAVNFTDSQDVVDAWMDSEGHRTNILNGDFTEIGIATARGEYKGRDTIFIVQFFGRPATAIAQTQSAGTTPVVQVEEPAPTPAQGESPEPVPVEEVVEGEAEVVIPEVEQPIISEEMFIQTEAIGSSDELTPGGELQIFTPKQANFIEEIASEPRATTNYMLIVLATIISVALVLKIFVNIKIQHPPLIVNGVAMLLVMSSAVLLNEYLSTLGAGIS